MKNTSPKTPKAGKPKGPNIFAILAPYKWMVFGMTVFAIATNGLNLILPKLLSHGIDAYAAGTLVLRTVVWQFFWVSLLVFIFVYLQNVVQTYASEKVAKDIRTKLVAKLSTQSYAYVQKATAGKLLTNLTSDVDAVKMFVSQAVVTMVSSTILIVGTSILLILIDWKLALAVLSIIPLIGVSFGVIFSKVGVLFTKTQEVVDWLNKVINESILGSALIRVLNSQKSEFDKFYAANTAAKDIGLQILKMFSALIPLIGFIANLALLIVLSLGGHFVINGSLSLGDFTAFTAYIAILIFPILMLGFMSSLISRASASYARIAEVLDASVDDTASGSLAAENLRGDVSVENVTVSYGEKHALKNVSLSVKAGSKTAIIGPTAAGKTQLLYLLTGLLSPQAGAVKFDGADISQYDRASLHSRIGFVFQDSVLFNLSLRENIAFSDTVKDTDLEKAIKAAELHDFMDALPEGLNTLVSERGTTLSGGQKQRIMLARALAVNPKVLLLDDFTARVDALTEKKILGNIAKHYPDITLISVTQKVASVEHYDQIVVLMEGEVLASGTHEELLEKSPEYVQIVNSQESTNRYELQA